MSLQLSSKICAALKLNAPLLRILRLILKTFTALTASYFSILLLGTSWPWLQTHSIYLHRLYLIPRKTDLNTPETFGFAQNQVVPFTISTSDSVTLHAWHILPVGLYATHQADLSTQNWPRRPVPDITTTLNFRLLRDDPDTRLVIAMHGASGCMASVPRPTWLRTLSAASPTKIHVLTFDYRGFGLSTGFPSQHGLLLDATAVFNWATQTAGIPPSRILLYGQSLGSAVAVSLADYLSAQTPPVDVAGVVISAMFTDLVTLQATYRLGGLVPVLAPIRRVPWLLRYFAMRVPDRWMVRDMLKQYVRRCGKVNITLVHAENDQISPVEHAGRMFWGAVEGSGDVDEMRCETPFKEWEHEMSKAGLIKIVDHEPESKETIWRTGKGLVRLHILKSGGHDWQMTYSVTALAVLRTFQEPDEIFEG